MPKANSEATHTFQLRPLGRPYYYQAISISFAPLANKPIYGGREHQAPSKCQESGAQWAGSESSKDEPLSVTPLFNHDRKHYTASFINPACQVQGAEALMLAAHHERVRESLSETPRDFIMVAKPRKKVNSYCSVCRDYYRDYLQHVATNDHRKAIKEAKFARHILDLVSTFAPPQPQLQNYQIPPPQEGVLTRAATRRREPEELQLDRPRKRLRASARNRSAAVQQPEETAREARKDQTTVIPPAK